jgi:hypothetical protein
MKYKSTADYKQQYQVIKDEYSRLDAVQDELQQILWKKLLLLCNKYPETPVTNVYSPPRPEDFFPAKQLVKKPRKWNPNYHYAQNYQCQFLLRYIEQIEKSVENL